MPWLIKLAIGREVNFPGASTDLMEWIIILCLVVVLFFGTLMAFKWKLNQKVGLVMLSMYAPQVQPPCLTTHCTVLHVLVFSV